MKGQTLIEILLAFALLGIVLTGIVVSVTSALSNASFAKTQTQATQYAQEGIELLQGIRDADYDSFRSSSGNYCLADGANSLGAPTNCSSVNVGNFVRSVNIEQSACATNVARATLTVAWSDGKCNGGTYCHKSQLISCLSTVNPIDLSSFSNLYSNVAAGPTPTVAAGPTPTVAAGPTLAPGATSIGLSISPNPATTSDAIIFTATVTGSGCTPTGAVYFYWDNQTSAYTAGSLGNSNPSYATAYYPGNAIGVGTHTVYAHYAPSNTACPAADSRTTNLFVN